jgi:RNA polymerase sigma-70 factor (ECF subfamily)
VFLKAYERFDTIGTSPTAGGWLKTVTTHLCINHVSRYRSRWRLFSELSREGDGQESEGFEAGLVADVSPAADLERADEQARLEAALRGLPSHQRVPIVLFHFEQQSYQEIAGLLGVSVGKVKTDIHRGREALRRFLGTANGPG